MSALPHCICHMVSSIDGRLLVDRWTPHAAGSKDELITRHYEAIGDRLDADAFIVGRTSLAEFDGVESSTPSLGERRARPAFRADGVSGQWAVVMDSQGKLRYGSGQAEEAPIISVLSHAVTDDYLDTLRSQRVSYVFAGDDGRDIAAALTNLREMFGVNRLLLEGGGVTNGTFLEANLIDEFSVLVYPGIDGRAGGPSIVEAQVPASRPVAAGLGLTFIASEVLDDGFVWLRYQTTRQ